ncbi:cupin domain-containing protein [Saccharopolyspora hirsuta]|uniref:Cupin domain-containing protein n=1 Tax=Saccharopolyspora hirsuta TaxID=1837 RepID=A0A5M7BNK5_SACHI|nr:cupin domain-containing protein [Saccharopolyspora hirsuta]KAA5831786.1 cupin domain-containing protein [Saccharopolyspora hirsuta]
MSSDTSRVHVPSDGGDAVFLVGDTCTTLLRSERTNGEFSMIEAIVPADAGPPPHTHHNESETFVLREGQLVINADDQEHEAGADDVVHIPKGVEHSFRSLSQDEPARMHLMHAPAGVEDLCTEIGTPGERGVVGPPLNDTDVAAMGAAADKHGHSLG